MTIFLKKQQTKYHEAVSKEQRIKKLNDTQLNEEYTKLNQANTKQQKEIDLIRKEISNRTQNQLKEFAKKNPEIGLQKNKENKKDSPSL